MEKMISSPILTKVKHILFVAVIHAGPALSPALCNDSFRKSFPEFDWLDRRLTSVDFADEYLLCLTKVFEVKIFGDVSMASWLLDFSDSAKNFAGDCLLESKTYLAVVDFFRFTVGSDDNGKWIFR